MGHITTSLHWRLVFENEAIGYDTPPCGKRVLITVVPDGKRFVTEGYLHHIEVDGRLCWHSVTGAGPLAVIAWMPLPEPA